MKTAAVGREDWSRQGPAVAPLVLRKFIIYFSESAQKEDSGLESEWVLA